MRIIFFILLVANLALWGAQEGVFGPIFSGASEPERMSHEIATEKIQLIAGDINEAKAAQLPPAAQQGAVACVEIGGFSGDDVRRAENQFDSLGITDRLTLRKTDEQASYIVYLQPFKSKADAERAAAELRRVGVTDFFIIQENGPYKLAISLGIFHSEEAAKAQLTSLTQLGVKNAKTGERLTSIAKTFYQLHAVEPDLAIKLNEMKSQYSNVDVHDCPTTSATTGAAAAGTTTVSSSGT